MSSKPMFLLRTGSLLTVVLGLSFITLTAQSIRFKTAYGASKSDKTLKFQNASFTGTLSSTHTTLVLSIRNRSGKNWSSNDINLVDLSGRGAKLCPEELLTLSPGEKGKVTYRPCTESSGLFLLAPFYRTKERFKEDAFFLYNKEWTLTIGGEQFSFFTAI